jgi:hypothetical protein
MISDHRGYGCTRGFCSGYSHGYGYGYENWYPYPYPYPWLYPSCLGKVSVVPQPRHSVGYQQNNCLKVSNRSFIVTNK